MRERLVLPVEILDSLWEERIRSDLLFRISDRT